MRIKDVSGDEVKILLVIAGVVIVGLTALHRSGPAAPPALVTGAGEPVEESRGLVTVDVSGAVWRPGVYELERGARVNDVLEKAMLRPDADIDRINRAQVLSDGQKLVVPSRSAPDGPGLAADEGPVNINAATVEQVMSLPGIGRVRAEEIIYHREREGPFESLEDLKRIPGIGEATVKRLRGRALAE